MIRLEKTVYKGRYNLVDTEKTGDAHYIVQMSRNEAIDLMDNISDVLLGDIK